MLAVKTRTYKQVETAKRRAELAADNLLDDPARANEFADMSVEEYAESHGISIQNPTFGGRKMASRIKELQEQLQEANARIKELEAERRDVVDALGIEIIDDEEEDDDENEDDEGDDSDGC